MVRWEVGGEVGGGGARRRGGGGDGGLAYGEQGEYGGASGQRDLEWGQGLGLGEGAGCEQGGDGGGGVQLDRASEAKLEV